MAATVNDLHPGTRDRLDHLPNLRQREEAILCPVHKQGRHLKPLDFLPQHCLRTYSTKINIIPDYLVQGIFQGLIGGMISMGIVWIVVQVVRLRFPHLLIVPFSVILVPFLVGLMVSYLGSIMALKRFLSG